MTTFLALVVLADSNSHAFLTFFKVFFLTVVFGLFHGIVFLPALLSWIGGENTKPESPDALSIQMTSNPSGTPSHNHCDSENVPPKDKTTKPSILDKLIVYLTGVEATS